MEFARPIQHEAVRRAVRTPPVPLPHAERIQRSFGAHDLSRVRAHIGGASTLAELDADAFTSGAQTAFASPPDLRTAAHEATHVVQQRFGRLPQSDEGSRGAQLERHADAVADRVVRGESAVNLLGAIPIHSASTARAAVPLQRQRRRKGRFTQASRSPGARALTQMFITSHMGGKRSARNIAATRQLPVSHTIDISELGRLQGEMHARQQQGYHVAANQVANPNGNANQYRTANTYKIWETTSDSKGRLKSTKLVQRPFYYDAPAGMGGALHHFDGPA